VEVVLGIVLVVAGLAVLTGLLKLAAGLLHALLVVLLVPFQLLGALLALVGGVLLLPVVLVGAVLVLVGLVAGFVAVPLLPFAILALLVVVAVRLVHPRSSRV